MGDNQGEGSRPMYTDLGIQEGADKKGDADFLFSENHPKMGCFPDLVKRGFPILRKRSIRRH